MPLGPLRRWLLRHTKGVPALGMTDFPRRQQPPIRWLSGARICASSSAQPARRTPFYTHASTRILLVPTTYYHLRGLWTSAATRRYVESTTAQGHPERVLAYANLGLLFGHGLIDSVQT
jgi:hypothetical protein